MGREPGFGCLGRHLECAVESGSTKRQGQGEKKQQIAWLMEKIEEKETQRRNAANRQKPPTANRQQFRQCCGRTQISDDSSAGEENEGWAKDHCAPHYHPAKV